MGEMIHIASAGMQCIGAYRADPVSAAKSGVVVVQEIFGVNAHIRSVVDAFAKAGHVAIAPALFDHLERDVELAYDVKAITKGRALITELGFDRALADVAGAAHEIASAGPVAVVGFCWGGTVALLASQRLGLPSVSYYGARNGPFLEDRCAAPLMLHFGENDASIPGAVVELHRAAFPQAAIHVYPAGHGFNCDQRADYDEASATLAMQRTLAFLDQHIGSRR